MLVFFSVSCNSTHYISLKCAVKHTSTPILKWHCDVSMGKGWWRWLLSVHSSNCLQHKDNVDDSVQGFTRWILKLTFTLNTYHVVTGNCRQTASAVMKDEDGNILKDPRAAHLSSASSLWLQYLFFTYSSGNFHPSVSHWTSFSTNQIICGCRKRL